MGDDGGFSVFALFGNLLGGVLVEFFSGAVTIGRVRFHFQQPVGGLGEALALDRVHHVLRRAGGVLRLPDVSQFMHDRIVVGGSWFGWTDVHNLLRCSERRSGDGKRKGSVVESRLVGEIDG